MGISHAVILAHVEHGLDLRAPELGQTMTLNPSSHTGTFLHSERLPLSLKHPDPTPMPKSPTKLWQNDSLLSHTVVMTIRLPQYTISPQEEQDREKIRSCWQAANWKEGGCTFWILRWSGRPVETLPFLFSCTSFFHHDYPPISQYWQGKPTPCWPVRAGREH